MAKRPPRQNHDGFVDGKKVKKLRKESGKSRLQFSSTTDVPYAVLFRVEEFDANIYVSSLVNIANGLNTTVGELIKPEKMWSKPSY